jgi:RNA polymerase sigma-70 factor (sigma-E family)
LHDANFRIRNKVLMAMVSRRGRPDEDAAIGPVAGRATIWRSTVLLGGVEPVVSDPRDELAAVHDIIATDDGEDFSAFATSRWPGLVRLAFGLTGDRWMAEDIAQTALAKAYVAWRRVSRADDPDAYLRRILVNASNRRFRRRRVTEQPGDPPETAVEGPAELVSERAALLAALRQLPPRQRAVVVLRYWEDLTDAQIAAALGCSPGTVRSQLSRALAKLRTSTALGEGDDT